MFFDISTEVMGLLSLHINKQGGLFHRPDLSINKLQLGVDVASSRRLFADFH
jgi:hypothetical protein